MDSSPQGSFASRASSVYDDTWRWGFDINRASSTNYVRDFHLTEGLTGDPNILTSQFYVEGFGDGSYARLDSKFYQGLNTRHQHQLAADRAAALRVQLLSARPIRWAAGSRCRPGAFNVIRSVGTNTRRASLTMDYERPFTGLLGDQWKITLHGDAAAYDASDLNELTEFLPHCNNIDTARALPQVAVDFKWPFARDGGAWGTQLIEPIVQVIVAPQAGDSQVNRYPNEDSLDFEFTDANLFGFNRFTGIDRLDGGERANVALHGAWYLGGVTFDGLVGQSYRTNKDNLFPVESGLRDEVSDIVARGTFSPTTWLDLTYRTRLDKSSLATHYAEAVSSVGSEKFRVSRRLHLHEFQPVYLLRAASPTTTRKPLLLSAQRGHPRGIIEMGLLPVQRYGRPRRRDEPDGLGRGRRHLRRRVLHF